MKLFTTVDQDVMRICLHTAFLRGKIMFSVAFYEMSVWMWPWPSNNRNHQLPYWNHFHLRIKQNFSVLVSWLLGRGLSPHDVWLWGFTGHHRIYWLPFCSVCFRGLWPSTEADLCWECNSHEAKGPLMLLPHTQTNAQLCGHPDFLYFTSLSLKFLFSLIGFIGLSFWLDAKENVKNTLRLCYFVCVTDQLFTE